MMTEPPALSRLMSLIGSVEVGLRNLVVTLRSRPCECIPGAEGGAAGALCLTGKLPREGAVTFSTSYGHSTVLLRQTFRSHPFLLGSWNLELGCSTPLAGHMSIREVCCRHPEQNVGPFTTQRWKMTLVIPK